VCVLDGAPGPWLPAGIAVLEQRGAGLDERLAAAFADVGGPALLIGMDTPQVTPALLADGLARLRRSDAVLGRAPDGGYWAIGLRAASSEHFHGVPMSAATTGAAQLARLREHGLTVDELPWQRDVDTIADAFHIAASCPPDGAFATELARISRRLAMRRVAA
jgi:glycosyltransferase A (GT-A) superfamily protein (DUF2064 family)